MLEGSKSSPVSWSQEAGSRNTLRRIWRKSVQQNVNCKIHINISGMFDYLNVTKPKRHE
jgi:hypothetical protein